MTLALFDLDHTLLEGDSDQLWGDFLLQKGWIGPDYQQRKNEFFADYQAGRLDIHAFARLVLSPLIGKRESELTALRREFGSQFIAARLRPAGMARIDWHRERGHRIVIITATNRFVAGASAELLDIGDLLASEPELHDGVFTGELTGTPCFREGKVTRLREFCRRQQLMVGDDFEQIDLHFYSDSHNDLPLLQVAHYAYAVTPDPVLQQAALERNWPVLDWRFGAES